VGESFPSRSQSSASGAWAPLGADSALRGRGRWSEDFAQKEGKRRELAGLHHVRVPAAGNKNGRAGARGGGTPGSGRPLRGCARFLLRPGG
jgi:hypothetical protein